MMWREDLKLQIEAWNAQSDALVEPLLERFSQACIQALNYARQSFSHRPLQAATCGLVGGIALVLPLEGRWQAAPSAISATVAVAAFAGGAHCSRRWIEESNLEAAIDDAEKLDMADELAVRGEAKSLQRRAAYGLPNSLTQQAEVQALIQQLTADGGPGEAAPQSASSSSPTFPEEDLAAKLAQYQGGWVLIVAPTGCGKTNFLNAAIGNAHSFYRGYVDFFVAAGKDNEKGYLGLERSPQDFYLCEADDQVEGFSYFHQGVMSLLQRGDNTIPVVYVADEWNNILLSAQVYDLGHRKATKEQELALSVVGGLTRGRTKRHFGWLTTHTPDVTAIGLPEKIKHSCIFLVFGRESLNGMLYEAIKGKQAIVQDSRLRKQLEAQLDAFYQHPETDKSRVVCLTNLGGPWRLVLLPCYGDRQPPLERGPLNQSTTELMEDEPPTPAAAPAPPPTRPFQAELLPEHGPELLEYLMVKESAEFNTRKLFQNWGKRRFQSTEDFKKFLARCITAGAITATDANLETFTLSAHLGVSAA